MYLTDRRRPAVGPLIRTLDRGNCLRVGLVHQDNRCATPPCTREPRAERTGTLGRRHDRVELRRAAVVQPATRFVRFVSLTTCTARERIGSLSARLSRASHSAGQLASQTSSGSSTLSRRTAASHSSRRFANWLLRRS